MGRHVHFWNAFGLHYVWDKGSHSDLSSKGGVKILHHWTLRDQLHVHDFVFSCVDGRQHCE